jgi:alkanesulfonate monooxygenase SsuD/methylene tetrahydromethanopterin reductase-like flavin-dependent oxidoreductase (luciferase family)
MKIGIGLPSSIHGTTPDLILDWARRADAGPFSSLGLIDRLVYDNYESLITLTAAATVTRRIRLMTTILIAPLRNAAILAKEAATLDVFSGGRLTLGFGVGGREDDFHAAHASFKGRGRHMEKQLELMKRIWSGKPVGDDVGPMGPAPVQSGGPEILIGGYTPEAIRRGARWADGYISGGGGDPAQARQNYDLLVKEWQVEGRQGKPRFVAAIYYALGDDARERGAVSLRSYYSFMGERVGYMVGSFPASDEAVKSAIQGFTDAGTDEFVLWPTIPDLDQVDRLAALVK